MRGISAACLMTVLLMLASPAYAEERTFWIEDYVEDPANQAGFSVSLFTAQGEEILPEQDCFLLVPDEAVRIVFSFWTDEEAGVSPGIYRLFLPENLLPEIERDCWFDAEAGGELAFDWRITGENVFEMRFFPGCEDYYALEASVSFEAAVLRSEEPLPLFKDLTVFADPEMERPGAFSLEKTGSYVLETGAVRWTVTADLPAHISGACARYSLSDVLYCGSYYAPSWEDIEASLSIGDETVLLKEVSQAGGGDEFSYAITSTDLNGTSTKSFTLLSRCRCSAQGCPDAEGCLGESRPAFCACHSLKKNARLTITWSEPPADESTFLKSGITNQIACNSQSAIAKVNPPDLLAKAYLGNEGNLARYKVQINGEGCDFGDETLRVEDTVNGAKLVPGSVRIYEEGVETWSELPEGSFETVLDEDLTGFSVQILSPGNRRFSIEYEVVPRRTGDVSNHVSLSAFGRRWKETVTRRLIYDSSVKSAKMKVRKRASKSLRPVAGALYGLFSEDGKMIASARTDTNGEALFSYNWTSGVIFVRERVYYVKELESPEGFYLDETCYPVCLAGRPEGYEGALSPLTDESVPALEVFDEQYFILPETGRGGISRLPALLLLLALLLFTCPPGMRMLIANRCQPYKDFIGRQVRKVEKQIGSRFQE